MKNIKSFLHFITIVWLLAIIGCKSADIPKIENPMQQLTLDVATLASDEMEGRETGTEGEKKAANYVANRFKTIGLSPKGTQLYYQEFTHKQKSNPHAIEPSSIDKTIHGRNVIGYIDNNAASTVIIGAHFDHLGYGSEGSLYTGDPAIHNGADDNASGVAAMLFLAEALKKSKYNANNYLFIGFSGEEKGLWGSNYFMDHPTIDTAQINYMINMDMVGRLDNERRLAIYGVGTSPVWKEEIFDIKSPKFQIKTTESGVGPSDHTSFYLEDIPVLHFFTGQHSDYHRPSDDVELINFSGINDVATFIYKLIGELNDEGKIAFTKTKDESTQAPDFKVTLGVVPDYLFDGIGMRIDGVKEDRPAFNAGLQKHDIVVKMGDLEVTDMMSYMQCLSKFQKGQTIHITVMRDGNKLVKKLTF
ncbi:MAG: M28 family peptidase [Saprospiraceae bacterium]|nr:M28 family peptidase [Saprospiraceae bacterium]